MEFNKIFVITASNDRISQRIEAEEITLGNAALQMTGVFTGRSDGIFNPHTARIAPGSILPVASNDSSNPSLRPLPLSGNLGIADGMLEMMQNNIRKSLFSDPMGELSDPVRSATEQVMRNQEFLKQSALSSPSIFMT